IPFRFPRTGVRMPSVLVIDNDAPTIAFAMRVLDAAGHRAAAVTSAGGALELLARERFDVVLLEILLPEKEGVETILEIQRHWPDTAVIAMSAGGALVNCGHILMLAKAVGAKEALLKPFSSSELTWAV